MVPNPLANGGSNSTISDQVILCHINFFRYEFFKSDCVSILRNYTLYVYMKCVIHFTGFCNFSFNFHEVGVVGRDLTKFLDCGFLGTLSVKHLKSHSDLLQRHSDVY